MHTEIRQQNFFSWYVSAESCMRAARQDARRTQTVALLSRAKVDGIEVLHSALHDGQRGGSRVCTNEAIVDCEVHTCRSNGAEGLQHSSPPAFVSTQCRGPSTRSQSHKSLCGHGCVLQVDDEALPRQEGPVVIDDSLSRVTRQGCWSVSRLDDASLTDM